MAKVQRKASLWMVNTSSIPHLVRRIQRGRIDEGNDTADPSEDERFARIANAVLNYVSKHCPAIYKLHTGEFAKALADETNPRLNEVALQALAAIRWDASDRYVV